MLERAPLEHRRQTTPDRLDLGQLRHYADNVEQDRPLPWRLVADLVRREHLPDGLVRACVVARVHLREDVARRDLGPALDAADDADGVVDRVLLRAASGPEMERGVADLNRAQPNDRAGSRRLDLAHDGSARQRRRIGIAALRADPTLVELERRAVGDRRLGARAGLRRRRCRDRRTRACARTRRARAR